MSAVSEIRTLDVRVTPQRQAFTLVAGIYARTAFIAGHHIEQHTSQDGSNIVIDLKLEINSTPEDPNKMHTMEMGSFKKEFNLGSLNPGKYVIRINGNNKWVHWFDVN